MPGIELESYEKFHEELEGKRAKTQKRSRRGTSGVSKSYVLVGASGLEPLTPRVNEILEDERALLGRLGQRAARSDPISSTTYSR
jgi:hypothetical protein